MYLIQPRRRSGPTLRSDGLEARVCRSSSASGTLTRGSALGNGRLSSGSTVRSRVSFWTAHGAGTWLRDNGRWCAGSVAGTEDEGKDGLVEGLRGPLVDGEVDGVAHGPWLGVVYRVQVDVIFVLPCIFVQEFLVNVRTPGLEGRGPWRSRVPPLCGGSHFGERTRARDRG